LAYYDFKKEYNTEPLDIMDLVDGNKAIEVNKNIENILVKVN
jgi:hypothetical protein